ncbi:MAG: hypothetical protein HRU01_17860 [Myxococcales bacterium]|nr:hypothetical protein [Myxococcales bacterium]
MKILVVLSIASLPLMGALVGVRLLLAGRRSRQLPELFVGLGLTLTMCIGLPLSAIGRIPAVVETAFGGVAFALGLFVSMAGVACLYAFTWRVFRANDAWAIGLVAAATLLLFSLALGLLDAAAGFTEVDQIFPRTKPWACAICVVGASAFVWTSIESVNYYVMLRRCLALGLADAVVANRFLLWSVTGVTVTALCAGLTTALLSGQAALRDPLPLALIAACGVVASTAGYLAFLPPEPYLRAIRQRFDRELGLGLD